MGRPRLPIEVVKARGNKHLTKAEIYEREKAEIKPIDDNIVAPAYLTKKQTNYFYEIANQLTKLKILGETDVDALARYIISNDLYVTAVKKLRTKAVQMDPNALLAWTKAQNQYFTQCRASANDLGLTISSRCKLVVPDPGNSEDRVVNKFSAFEKVSNG